jgi:hypothetical protein
MQEVAAMSNSLRHYATVGDAKYRSAYEANRATVLRMFDDFDSSTSGRMNGWPPPCARISPGSRGKPGEFLLGPAAATASGPIT